jgi:hypothetical protein
VPLFLDDFDAHVFAVTVGTVFFCLWFFARWRSLKAKQAVIREWDSWAARNPEETNTSWPRKAVLPVPTATTSRASRFSVLFFRELR